MYQIFVVPIIKIIIYFFVLNVTDSIYKYIQITVLSNYRNALVKTNKPKKGSLNQNMFVSYSLTYMNKCW